jgi:hypothetical protein
VNHGARAFAVARVDQWILFSGFISKTNLARTFKFFFHVKDVLSGAIHDLEINGLSFFGVIDFQYNKFDSSKFDEVSNC